MPAEGRGTARDVVADGLRRRIAQGELRVGQQIPTQAELGEQFSAPRGAVRRALELLENEGLIKRARQGTPAEVVQRVPDHPDPDADAGDASFGRRHQPRTAGLELTDRVARAFRSPHVRIDAYCASGETLASALAGPVVAVTAGEQRPLSLRVRILLPDPDNALALPQVVGDPQDSRPRARLREVTEHIWGSLRHSLRMLEVRELVPEVRVEARKVSITPTQRVFVLNGEEVLTGHYQVLPRRVELSRDPMEIYDMLGLDGILFRHTAVPGDQVTEAYVEQTKLWFDSLWDTIARPMEP
ncbi:winged helix-turn-helix domain-containing protein [Streptomyces sp. NPDC054784]